MFTSDTSVLLLMCVIVFLHCGTGLVTGYFFHHHKGTVKGHCEHHNIMKSRYRQCQYLLINIPGVFFVLFCFVFQESVFVFKDRSRHVWVLQ